MRYEVRELLDDDGRYIAWGVLDTRTGRYEANAFDQEEFLVEEDAQDLADELNEIATCRDCAVELTIDNSGHGFDVCYKCEG